MAFTAGTGILVFIDLVAHLIRKNLGQLDPEEEAQLTRGFRFIFYVSFPKVEESIAIDLCQGLQELCQRKNLKNFHFYPRFSTISKERWD
jgi:hypothetical protein